MIQSLQTNTDSVYSIKSQKLKQKINTIKKDNLIWKTKFNTFQWVIKPYKRVLKVSKKIIQLKLTIKICYKVIISWQIEYLSKKAICIPSK